MSRDPANKGKAVITDTTLMTIQGSRAKGQSVMEESGESSKGKTPSLPETRASRVTFEKPPEEMTKHLRPLYIRAHIDGKPVSRVLVDNGAAVNILPLRIVRRLSKPGDRIFENKKECNEVKSTLTFGALEYKFREVIPVWNCSIYRMGGGKDRIKMGTKSI